MFLSEAFAATLDWQKSGKLECANSPFGLLLRSTDGLWLLTQKHLTQLELSDDGQYLSVESDGSNIGFIPIQLGYLDKLIYWLIEPSFAVKVPLSNLPDANRIAKKQKSELLQKFDDGDITTKEFLSGLEAVLLQESDVLARQIAINRALSKVSLVRKKLLLVFFVVLMIGFFLGLGSRPWVFGFSSAEQCAIEAKTRSGVAACYSLYPSVDK